jgi:superfamily II DNA/RNA helicase
MSTPTSARARDRGRPGNPRRKSRGQHFSENRNRTRATPKAAPPRPTSQSPLERSLDEAATHEVTITDFVALGLPPVVVDCLAEIGITRPSEVQARTIPDALAGRDVLGRAQTGSGKTLAFGLPLLMRLAQEDRPAAATYPRALVLAPTRELAQQVADALASVARPLGLSVLAIYGGAAMDRQVRALARGVDVVVATPGRLEDHMRRRTCRLDRVGITVLDEADHMADLGFLPSVTNILDQIPLGTQRLLFSATLDRGVESLALDYLQEPTIHAATAATASVSTMEHRAFGVSSDQKVEIASRIAARHGRTLVFVRTKHGADRLAKQLERHGINSETIHGNRSQAQRQRALEEFSTGRRPVLVATDVAARGIHVDGVDCVMHFDPPADHKDYLHRSGRTARAGESGLVLSLVLPHEARKHKTMQRDLGVEHALVTVDPDHPAVVEIAESGVPIVVTPRSPRFANDSSGGGGGQRNNRPRNRQQRGRPRGRER